MVVVRFASLFRPGVCPNGSSVKPTSSANAMVKKAVTHYESSTALIVLARRAAPSKTFRKQLCAMEGKAFAIS